MKSIKKVLQSSDYNWTLDEQHEVIIHTIQEEKDLLVALSTSSRKSMVSMLAAILGGRKIFLVIIPLISLLKDWKCQLKSSGTRYSVF